MLDYGPLIAEWEDLLGRRRALAEPLGFWTAVLEGWTRWKPASREPLRWPVADCRRRWEGGRPLLPAAEPVITPEETEPLLGPVMERLASESLEAARTFEGFAHAWDRAEVGPGALLPRAPDDPAPSLEARFGLIRHLAGFLALAALRPPLEHYFQEVRSLPEGLWQRGICPWCGDFAAYGDLTEEGRRRLSCHLCAGIWLAPRLKCPFCESWESRHLVRLLAEGMEEGYFIEACAACRGYMKGVDRRQRWNAGSPLVEDWGSPHLDVRAARQGYWRPTPSLAHLLPPEDR